MRSFSSAVSPAALSVRRSFHSASILQISFSNKGAQFLFKQPHAATSPQPVFCITLPSANIYNYCWSARSCSFLTLNMYFASCIMYLSFRAIMLILFPIPFSTRSSQTCALHQHSLRWKGVLLSPCLVQPLQVCRSPQSQLTSQRCTLMQN